MASSEDLSADYDSRTRNVAPERLRELEEMALDSETDFFALDDFERGIIDSYRKLIEAEGIIPGHPIFHHQV